MAVIQRPTSDGPPQRGPWRGKGGHTPGSRVARGPPVARPWLLGSRPRDPTEDWVMPADRDFKRLVRARMGRTGESYTTARSHLRPDGDPGRPDRFRGRHPDTAALTGCWPPSAWPTRPATGR